MSRFTRPQLLFWRAQDVVVLFGEDLFRRFAHAAASLRLELAGIVARPLYKCTEQLSAGGVCMKVASMSPFLKMSEGRFQYKCRDCMAKAENLQVAPGSASVSLRGLYAYPTVKGADDRPTPLRVGAVPRLLVHAPPEEWRWRGEREAVSRVLTPVGSTEKPAASPKRSPSAKSWYTYTAEESKRIWYASTYFPGHP